MEPSPTRVNNANPVGLLAEPAQDHQILNVLLVNQDSTISMEHVLVVAQLKLTIRIVLALLVCHHVQPALMLLPVHPATQASFKTANVSHNVNQANLVIIAPSNVHLVTLPVNLVLDQLLLNAQHVMTDSFFLEQSAAQDVSLVNSSVLVVAKTVAKTVTLAKETQHAQLALLATSLTMEYVSQAAQLVPTGTLKIINVPHVTQLVLPAKMRQLINAKLVHLDS